MYFLLRLRLLSVRACGTSHVPFQLYVVLFKAGQMVLSLTGPAYRLCEELLQVLIANMHLCYPCRWIHTGITGQLPADVDVQAGV